MVDVSTWHVNIDGATKNMYIKYFVTCNLYIYYYVSFIIKKYATYLCCKQLDHDYLFAISETGFVSALSI